MLIAAAILAVGLSGLALAIIQTSKTLREGDRRIDAAMTGFGTAERTMGEVLTQGVVSLAPGVYDGGAVYDDAGVLLFTRTLTVRDLGSIDGGVAYPGVHVQVSITWRDSILTTRTQNYATIISAPFDGGP